MRTEVDIVIGKRLIQARRLAGLTLRELAERLGWPYTTLGNYESGRRSLPVTRLYAIAAALGRTPSALLVDTPEAAALVDVIASDPERAIQIHFVLETLESDMPKAPEEDAAG